MNTHRNDVNCLKRVKEDRPHVSLSLRPCHLKRCVRAAVDRERLLLVDCCAVVSFAAGRRLEIVRCGRIGVIEGRGVRKG